MKARKRQQLIREIVAGTLSHLRPQPATYATVDLTNLGMEGDPLVISFPVDSRRLLAEGRAQLDLGSIGYRLVRR